MSLLQPGPLAAFCLFALVASITPGPNNAMLMVSGANFGLRRTVPHLLGVIIGFAVLLLAAGLGLGALFAAWPPLQLVLQAVGAAYLIYMAWRIAMADGVGGGGKVLGKPFTFVQASLFQWVNPKAWAIGLGAVATYAPHDDFVLGVVVITVLIGVINIPCALAWAAAGVALRRFLARPAVLRAFNWTMAALLAASLWPALVELARGVRP
jgi:threonine/homoserine/homoserine lactone efflux protein